MGAAVIFFAAVGGIISTIAVGLLKDEVTAWLPRLSDCILRAAVKRLPADRRERYSEEWSAHINEYPGRLTQIAQAIKILTASYSTSLCKERTVEQNLKLFLIVMWSNNAVAWFSGYNTGIYYLDIVLNLINHASNIFSIVIGWFLIANRKAIKAYVFSGR